MFVNIMRDLIRDRIFWIYFIITLFFIILGISLMIGSSDPQIIVISILWILSCVLIMLVIYHLSYLQSWMWLFINGIFLALLIVSTLWTTELNNSSSDQFHTISGIFIILGALILTSMINDYIVPFWFALGYIIIWLGLTIYITV